MAAPPRGPGGEGKNQQEPEAQRPGQRKIGGDLEGEPVFRLPGPAADSHCRHSRPPAGRQQHAEKKRVGESPAQAERRSLSAIAGGLLGGHVSMEERHGLVERECRGILVARLGWQTVLQLLQRQLHRLAR